MIELNTERRIGLASCHELDSVFARSLSLVMEARAIADRKRGSILNVNRFIQQVWATENKAIVDVPCGGGKSLWSLATILSHVEKSRANPEGTNPLYLVVDTLKTGRERLNTLLSLGVPNDYVGFYHSFWQAECEELRDGKGYAYEQVVSNRHLCSDCPAHGKCGYHNRYSHLNRPVVILVHEGFIRLLENGRIPSGRDIIIDEEPNPYYMATFKRKDVERLAGRLQSIRHRGPQLDAITESITALHMFAVTLENQRCTRLWTKLISQDDKVAVYHHLRRHLGPDLGSADIGEGYGKPTLVAPLDADDGLEADNGAPWEEEFLRQHSLTLLGDLGYALREGAECFVYADLDKISIARRRMDLGIPNRVLLLNGSASLYRHVMGEHMQVFSCPDLKEEYPNVVIHCIEALPTKRRLKDRAFMERYVSFAKEALGDADVGFLAINKRPMSQASTAGEEEDTSIEGALRKAFPMVKEENIGERGSLIGSNQWVEEGDGIIAMSLFTDIAHYALHASLRHGREISADEMFQVSNGRTSLKVSKIGHLSPHEVDDELRREAAHELYQTIMRLKCREDSAATINVVVVLPYVELLSDLHRLMPNIQVRGGKDGNLEWLWDVIRSPSPIPNADWYRANGLDPTSGRNIRRAKELGEAFGRRPEKRGGNFVFWVIVGPIGRN